MKAALFDMDGTLIDSERYYFSIWQELMAQEGYHLEKDFYQHVVGSPTSILKEKFQNHFGELQCLIAYSRNLWTDASKPKGRRYSQ